MLDEKLTQYIGYIQKAALQAGPGATQLALDNTRWGAVQDLATGFIALLGLMLSIWMVTRHWKWFLDCAGDVTPFIIAPILIAICGIVIPLYTIANTWNWVSVFNPRLALFHNILEKLLGS